MGPIRDWQEFLRAEGKSEETVRKYGYPVARFLGETTARSLGEVREEHVVTFLARLGKQAPARELYTRALKSFFDYCQRRGLIETNPAAGLRPKKPNKPEPDAYTPQEIMALMEVARRRNPRWAWAIQAAYALGLRRSELCGITAEDIDWQGRRVYLRVTKGNKPRWVEMSDLASGALKELTRHNLPKDYPVVGFSPQWFTMIVGWAAASAGLPPRRRKAHMLRASAATHMLGNGAPISVVSKLLGHADVAVTSRYLAVNNGDRRRAVDSLSLAVG